MRKLRQKETFIILLVLAIYFHIESCRSMTIEDNNNNNYNNSTESNTIVNNEYYGGSPAERQNFALHRHRRFFEPMTITTSLVLTLFLWNFLAGPFLQAQLVLKINVASWFQPEGCAHRMWKNGMKRVLKGNLCMPTNDEIYERELGQQMYQQMFEDISEKTAQLLFFKHNLLMDMAEPLESLENLSTRENLYLLLFKYRLVPFDVGRVPETFLKKEEDVHSMRFSRDFTKVWQNGPSEEKCEEMVKEWKADKEGKFRQKEAYFPLLQCVCIRLQSDWTKHGFAIDLQTVENCIDILVSKTDMTKLSDEKFVQFAEKSNGGENGEDIGTLLAALTVLPKLESEAEKNAMAEKLHKIDEIYGIKIIVDKMEEPKKPDDKVEEAKRMDEKQKEQKRLDVIFAEFQKDKRKMEKLKMKEIWGKLLEALHTNELKDAFLNRLEEHLMVEKSVEKAAEEVEVQPHEVKISNEPRISPVAFTPQSSAETFPNEAAAPIESDADNKAKKKNFMPSMDSVDGLIPASIVFFKRLWHGETRNTVDWPENFKCDAKMDLYSQNCPVSWKSDSEGAERKLALNDEIIDSKSYPMFIVDLFKNTSKEAAQKFDDSKFGKLQKSAKHPATLGHIKQMFIMIEMRRAICDVHTFGRVKRKEAKAQPLRKKWRQIKRRWTTWARRESHVKNAEGENEKIAEKVKEEKFYKNLPTDFLKQFGKVCKNFYAQNKKERKELLALEGFGMELDGFWRNVKVDEEYEKWKNDPVTVERLKALKKEEAEALKKKEEEEKAKFGQIVSNGYQENLGEDYPEENTVEKKRKKCGLFSGSSLKKCLQLLRRRPRRKREATNDDRSHKFDHYFGSNIYSENGSENGDKSLKVYVGNGVVRKKRFAVSILVGFTLSLIFLQIYMRIHQKYDPVKWLWMCMKYPRSWCQVPAPIQKEVAFIKMAKQIVVEEMALKTVAKLRKLYEIAYVQYLYHYGKKALVLPSQFLANKLKISLNIRHRYLLDCYTYNWDLEKKAKVTDEIRKGLPIILTDLINATKTHCISFTDIMPKEQVPKKMVHFSKHFSQMGGNL